MHPSLRSLQCWPRLDVGPAVVTPRRVVIPYRIGAASTDLVYSYDEDVFDPENPDDVALAHLIGAQVALNYGLFAERVVLHGPFTETSRAFLRDMAENTAREIYCVKLRRKNPFLVGLDVPKVPADASFRPNLEFPDAVAAPARPWNVDPRKVLVLSSGGKDSLLTLGMLEELGVESHAIFANESGRHWYSALNSWRHLSATRPNTARVWTTCDRVFVWAKRQMPFIRPDFQRVRSDDYPIRLWTVAVFLFGTLPLARRRGLGTLLVGDEWDTSQTETLDGIPHYCGLYDQSRWFDDELTAFYRASEFGVTQCSALRSASETIIETALATRYPELFAHQVSCHAAHIQGGRVHPCGRCEKCRRIVGMLLVAGQDPRVCGYTDGDVARSVEALAASGTKHIGEDAAHLAWQLVQGGWISADSPLGSRASAHPETVSLRFDPLRSPPDVLPGWLRAGVHEILRAHAEGAYEQVDGAWTPIQRLPGEP